MSTWEILRCLSLFFFKSENAVSSNITAATAATSLISLAASWAYSHFLLLFFILFCILLFFFFCYKQKEADLKLSPKSESSKTLPIRGWKHRRVRFQNLNISNPVALQCYFCSLFRFIIIGFFPLCIVLSLSSAVPFMSGLMFCLI